MNHSEDRLPKWIQEELSELRGRITTLENELNNVKEAHVVLFDRKWFAIQGPSFADKDDIRKLWFLDKEHPFPVCSLGKGDVLLVGRNAR